MSGYRSIKRVLGERSLERKCRFLFGTCLLLMLSLTFWTVDRVAENLVIEKTNNIGRGWANTAVINLHWLRWETDTTRRAVALELSRDLLHDNFKAEVLALPNDRRINRATDTADEDITFRLRKPNGEPEEELLRRLEVKWRESLKEVQTPESPLANKLDTASLEAFKPKTPADTANSEVTPAFETVSLPEEGKYLYYQPVYWNRRCFRCHERFPGDSVAASERHDSFSEQSPQFTVMKIIMPYETTRAAINKVRALLMAVAILTVFFSMFALYGIVRYVIVKPLHHLRDVSDSISRGDSETRADLHTGDEFEELAESFNRMLRHMIESQSDLLKVNCELDAKVDELAQLNMRLYEMNRLKSDFLANMSHELRTPLNSIIGFSEVLQGIDSLNDKQKRYAQNIQKSGRVLLEMINDILDLAKLESGKMDIRLSEFQIDSIVSAQCDMIRSLTDEKNIDLNVVTQPDLPPVFQDQGKIQQIITNLLSNAIKFTPEGGRITVSTRMDPEGRLDMSVADTGVGIAPQDRDIIFEKFRQGSVVVGDDGLTRQYSGTGLGLSIVREICRLLGGEVSVESEVGKGSTFKIVLPWSRNESTRLSIDVSNGAKTVVTHDSWTKPALENSSAVSTH